LCACNGGKAARLLCGRRFDRAVSQYGSVAVRLPLFFYFYGNRDDCDEKLKRRALQQGMSNVLGNKGYNS